MSSKINSGEYSDQSAEKLALKLPKGVFFARINPLDPGDQIPSQKHLVVACGNMFAGENWLATA
jgi:hypothetical protein